jgi:hypothetical protein
MTYEAAKQHCFTSGFCSKPTIDPVKAWPRKPLMDHEFGEGTMWLFQQKMAKEDDPLQTVIYRTSKDGRVLSMSLSLVGLAGVTKEEARELILKGYGETLGSPTLVIDTSRWTTELVWGCQDRRWVSLLDNAIINCSEHSGYLAHARISKYDNHPPSIKIEWIDMQTLSDNKKQSILDHADRKKQQQETGRKTVKDIFNSDKSN